MTGMEVYPGPGRAFDDRFWKELAYDAHDEPAGQRRTGRARGPDFPRPDKASFP